MTYRTPEQRRHAAAVAYHSACAAQYTQAANTVLATFPKLRERALDNAQFHVRKLDALAPSCCQRVAPAGHSEVPNS